MVLWHVSRKIIIDRLTLKLDLTKCQKPINWHIISVSLPDINMQFERLLTVSKGRICPLLACAVDLSLSVKS